MTGPGTNSYLVGASELVAIDPGPKDDAHVGALLEAASRRGGRICAVLVTHTHPDHAPGATALGARAGAPLLGWGERDGFVPDRVLRDGDHVGTGDGELTALHTPGHASNHLCYMLSEPRILFSGDHIMGGSTVVIAPPDGDMAAYLSSLSRLARLSPPIGAIAPGHGAMIRNPVEVIEQYRAHRLAREASVLAVLGSRGGAGVGIDEIVAEIYVEVPVELHPIARYSVWAHLLKLRGESKAACERPDDISAAWSAVGA
ncbi:MAG: MBL fold metallo-hydrolase [Acidimicrobiales bacterium]